MERASRRPRSGDHDGDRDRGGSVAPPIAEAGERKPDDDGDRAKHVGGEMQRVGGQRLASGLARGPMQRARPPEIHGDVDQQHDEGDGRDGRRRRAFAQAAVGFDQNAAGQHVEHRDDAERGDALELAVAVMMLLVRGSVGNPHHHPGDDGRDHVDRTVQGFGNQRQTADGDADHEFGRGHAGAGEDRNRRDAGFDGVGMFAHGRSFISPSVNIKAPISGAIASHLQERSVANCSELRAIDADCPLFFFFFFFSPH